jgi:hypothetical protein
VTRLITGKPGVIIGLGFGLVFGPAQDAATSGVKSHEAGEQCEVF